MDKEKALTIVDNFATVSGELAELSIDLAGKWSINEPFGKTFTRYFSLNQKFLGLCGDMSGVVRRLVASTNAQLVVTSNVPGAEVSAELVQTVDVADKAKESPDDPNQPNTPTPGPWGLGAVNCSVVSYRDGIDEFVASTGGIVIDASFFSNVPGRAEANAKLIAAAPDMLRFIQSLAEARHDRNGGVYLEAWANQANEWLKSHELERRQNQIG